MVLPKPVTQAVAVGASSIGPVRPQRPYYLQRRRFHGFQSAADLPSVTSLIDLSYSERVLLRKRLTQHRLQEMIVKLETLRPDRIVGELARKIERLKELSTRP